MRLLLKLSFCATWFLCATGVLAQSEQEVVQTVFFSAPTISLTDEGLTRVGVLGCDQDCQSGLPVLPVKGVSLELPSGADIIRLTLVPGVVTTVPLTAPVEWGVPPLSPAEPPAGDVAPDPVVYEGQEPYPSLQEPRWRSDPTGPATLLSVQVPAVRFDPARNALLAAKSMTVCVTFRVKPSGGALLTRKTSSPLEAGAHTYAIISTSNLISATPGPWNLQALSDARARAGFTPAIVSTEWISENYPGTNQANRIRAFVQDAYQTWGLRYLLLAGTFDLLPVQRLYISFSDLFFTRAAEIPADAIFYGCMDGSFDNNGNGRYGETTDGLNGRDVDLTAEVMVGRFPVSNAVELASMVRKTLRYEAATAHEISGQGFVAEKVNLGSLVYADGYMEELRYGAANDGLNSMGFKNSPYTNVFCADLTLYDTSNYLFSANDALAFLNRNLAAVNHMGHGSAKQCFKIPLILTANQSAIAAFTNEIPYFMYSQACNAGEFDTPDCFAEQLVTVSNAAFAAVMNAREGWEYANVVGGFSHRYHRAFWDAALRGSGTRLGEINELSRRANLHLLSTTPNYWRWVFYELNLFGDPATPFVPAVNLVPPAVSHTPLANTYDTQSLYRVTCTVEPIGIYDPDSIRLVWSTDRTPGVALTQRMNQVSGNLFEAFIEPQPANTRVSYALSARNHAGCQTTSPEGGENVFYVTERLTLTIMGSPTGYGAPSPDYGSYSFASGLVATASAPSTIQLGDDVRVSNIGFFGTGSAPQSGTNQTVSFPIAGDSLLVWMWRHENLLTLRSDSGTPPEKTYWVVQDAAFAVPAAPGEITLSNGTTGAFAEWRLDGARAPAPPALSAPSYGEIVMSTPHVLSAHYLPADLDGDTNGVPDWWEYRYFGKNGQDPNADADGDGYTFAQEFQDRSNPLSAASVPASPEITFTPLVETQARPGPFTIRATITDTHMVENAYVYWHRRTDAWQSTPFHALSNNVFEAEIGALSSPGDDFEYQLIASDPSGRTSQTDLFYMFLVYPVADTSRFHDLSFVVLPTQSMVGAFMNLHNTGNADLIWSVRVARAESIIDPALPCWSRTSLGQSWNASTNRFVSAPYSLYSRLQSSNSMNGPSVHSSITMHPFVVGPRATLSFSYWIHSEIDLPSSRAFDGGIVEYSLDNGETFRQLKGPYTHTIYGWTYSPWTNNTPCFAGTATQGWRTVTFDFAKEYPEENGFLGRSMTLRFHYGGDNNTDYEGWYLDNITASPIEWPQGFGNSLENTYSYTIPAGGNKRIFWDNMPVYVDQRDSHATISLLSNDPAAPVFSFFWQIKVREHPLVPDLWAAQSAAGDGLVALAATVADRDGEPVGLSFDWSGDGGKTWRPAVLTNLATAVGVVATSAPNGAVANLLTATNGVPVTNRLAAVWESRAVSPALTVCTQTLFRAVATNGYYGNAFVSPPFVVDNVPPVFNAGSLSVAPLSEVGPYALTSNALDLSWPPATDDPSTTLTYRLIDTQTGLTPAVSSTNLTALDSAALSLSNALDRAHLFEVVALDPAGNASAPLSGSLMVLSPASDFDGDGLCNADEETAGTLATDPASRFAASLQPAAATPGHLSLTWDSASNRLYTIESSPSLLPTDWQPVPGCSNLSGTGSTLSFDLPTAEPAAFYRIRVFLKP